MTEMLDRVAAPIAAEIAELTQDQRNTMRFPEDFVGDTIDRARSAARAAIAAMREPTEDMKKCNEEVHWGYSCHTCGGLTEGWYAMIDAALK